MGSVLKKLINQEFFAWLDDDDNIDDQIVTITVTDVDEEEEQDETEEKHDERLGLLDAFF